MSERVEPEQLSKVRRTRSLEKFRKARKRCDVRTLVAGLNDPADGWTAAKYLREMGASEAVPDIRKHVASPNPFMRAEVLTTLGAFRVTDAIPEVCFAATRDSQPWVRAAAIQAGEQLMPLDELRPLLHAGLKDEGWNARFASAQILGRHGDESDLAVLDAAKLADVWWRRSEYRKAQRGIRRRMSERR